MPDTLTIRIKALFLTAIFAGNFFAVCRCSGEAVAAPSAIMRMNGKDAHCCCRQKSSPCKDGKSCPGMRVIKFNLLEKKAAAAVRLNTVDAMIMSPEFVAPTVEGRLAQCNASSCYLPPHAPPDRLALYQCYLI